MGDNGQPDIERRLKALEDSIVEIRKSDLDQHKWFTTGMFTLVAILLTVLAVISKSDVREAIHDMQTDMRERSAEMDKKYDKLSQNIESEINRSISQAQSNNDLVFRSLKSQLEREIADVKNNFDKTFQDARDDLRDKILYIEKANETQCHRAVQNQPLAGTSESASLRSVFHNRFLD